jgi:nitrate/nitrite transport system permease protein
MTEISAMNVQALKTEPATLLAKAPADVVALAPKARPKAEKYGKMAKDVAAVVIPPLVVVILPAYRLDAAPAL